MDEGAAGVVPLTVREAPQGATWGAEVLQLPGLYLLARPIVPVASGRLCAESDPAQRFWAAASPGTS